MLLFKNSGPGPFQKLWLQLCAACNAKALPFLTLRSNTFRLQFLPSLLFWWSLRLVHVSENACLGISELMFRQGATGPQLGHLSQG